MHLLTMKLIDLLSSLYHFSSIFFLFLGGGGGGRGGRGESIPQTLRKVVTKGCRF